MIIIKKYLTNNDCYKSATKMNIQGLMLHSVGCNVENPMNFINSWNKSGVFKAVHAFIGQNAIYETLPYDFRAWHCGRGLKGSFNDGYISVEMTEPKTINYLKGSEFTDEDKEYTKRFVKNSYKNAVWYFAHLCKKFNLNPLKENTILSHSEAYKLGYASDHGDVEHIWDYIGLSMMKFREDINKEMNIFPIKNNDEQKDKIFTKKHYVEINRTPILINKSMTSIDMINIDGYNYAKLDDLKKYGLNINYDKENRIIYLNL